MYKFVKISHPVDLQKNFWDTNFQVSLIEPFRSLYLRDTTPDKHISSSQMYCIYLWCDPSYDNKLYRQPEASRKSAVLAYYPDFDFNDPLIAECLMAYPECCLTSAAKSFRQEEDTLRKFAQLIEEKLQEDLTLDHYITLGNNRYQLIKGTAGQIADLKKKNSLLYVQYDKIRRTFEEEQSQMRLFGGGEETLMDEGSLIEIEDDD